MGGVLAPIKSAPPSPSLHVYNKSNIYKGCKITFYIFFMSLKTSELSLKAFIYFNLH